ncbi:MAG TPA: hypothetical protein DCG21_06755 [Gammaproteobacteria bacterium]|nr:hypothetical protein [Acidiferrobacteraceae bacterium]HAF74921.1 hypothetical protein [Gammaproteobacteria bacterium]
MGKMVFVPLSDEMIYEQPELITGPIGTFAPGKVEFPDLEQAEGKGAPLAEGQRSGGSDRPKNGLGIRSK